VYHRIMPFPVRLTSRALPATALAALVGCGGPSFSVVAGDGGTDAVADHAVKDGTVADVGTSDAHAKDAHAKDAAAAGDASVADSTAKDAPGRDAPVDTARPDAPVDGGTATGTGCSVVGGADNVYVTTAGTAAGPGTLASPFGTIAAGIKAAAALGVTRAYVCVGAGRYTEPNLIVPAHVTVVGTAGAASTTLVGTSSVACLDKTTCALTLSRGSQFQGFTVAAPPGPDASTLPENGIVTLGVEQASDLLVAAPAVWNVVVNGFTSTVAGGGVGIDALSDVDVGPNVTANGNAIGLVSSAPNAAVVHVKGTTNHFDGNGGHGMDFVGAASLLFEGGSTSNNPNCGIRLGGSAPDAGLPPHHTISNLTATGNGNHGIAVYTPVQYLTLRGSTVLAGPPAPSTNGNSGLFFSYGSAAGASPSALDIGTPGDPGNNTFGVQSPQAGSEPKGAGLFLCGASPASQLAAHDSFSQCLPILQTAVATCGTLPAAYVDVAYTLAASTTGSAPVVATSCTVGQ